MALFGSKKNTEAKPAKKTADKKAEKAESKAVAVVESAQENIRDISGIIKRPRITEKASMKAEANVYAFEIAPNANKKTVAYAIKSMYNVTPVKVAIVKIPKKQKFIRNKMGVTGGGKKAYVYLKKGDTIEFV